MSKLRFQAVFVALLAGLQAGCGAMPPRDDLSDSSGDGPRPQCDTSVRYIGMGTRIRNHTGADIEFNLVGGDGPPYHPAWMTYRVYSGDLGETPQLVHNGSRGSEWNQRVTIAPGESADFSTPIFGLRRGDYYRWFRIEMRDSRGRSYWTPPFDLCSVVRTTKCGCPDSGAMALSVPALPLSCPTVPAPARCE